MKQSLAAKVTLGQSKYSSERLAEEGKTKKCVILSLQLSGIELIAFKRNKLFKVNSKDLIIFFSLFSSDYRGEYAESQ